MWELICDQRYRWGTIAADRSGWRSDGVPTNVAVGDGGFGIRFVIDPGTRSHIAIPRKKPWDTLEGIRIEIIVRLTDPSGTLISGHNSFGIYMPGPEMIVAEAGGDSINNQITGVIPPHGPWINITFEHNGLNAMALYVEGQVAASGPAAHAIPGVGPLGVSIGGPTVTSAGQDTLSGTIASVRIWRIDPRSMNRGLLTRPIGPHVAQCWADFLHSIRDALHGDTDCSAWLNAQVGQIIANVTNALRNMPQSKANECCALGREYALLWQAGSIDTSQMRDFMSRFRAWFSQNGVTIVDQQQAQTLLDSPCFQKVLGHMKVPTCDPQIVALIGALVGSGASPSQAPGP
jgi:Concanavalin A-like lectin/glucanases superfamily